MRWWSAVSKFTKSSPTEGHCREPRLNEIWHIITPEYPPKTGGVSGYAYQVAAGLRKAGDEVHVWCGGEGDCPRECRGLDCVHWLPEGMGPAGLTRLTRELDRFPGPRRLLVQWVPHGYGWRSMNVPFCLWLWKRARRGDRVEIMLHEAFLQFGEGNLRQDAAAMVHRAMTVILLRAAARVWMSTPSWEHMWRPYALGRRVDFEWLPVPANVPVSSNQQGVKFIRERYAPNGETILGHFSTHGKLITRMLDTAIPALLQQQKNRVCLLIGQSGERYRDELIRANPDLAGRVAASGSIDASDISLHLLACDLLLQPYPEGITARRTSAMAGLAHGIPMVSSIGPMTESFWASSRAIALASRETGELARVAGRVLADSKLARNMAERARLFYDERFEARHMIRALRRELTEPNRLSGSGDKGTTCCGLD